MHPALATLSFNPLPSLKDHSLSYNLTQSLNCDYVESEVCHRQEW